MACHLCILPLQMPSDDKLKAKNFLCIAWQKLNEKAKQMDTVYTERANGQQEYWTYSDGQRIYVTAKWAKSEQARGFVRIVDLHDRDIKLWAARR